MGDEKESGNVTQRLTAYCELEGTPRIIQSNS